LHIENVHKFAPVMWGDEVANNDQFNLLES
jgi:hypothetical protein